MYILQNYLWHYQKRRIVLSYQLHPKGSIYIFENCIFKICRCYNFVNKIFNRSIESFICFYCIWWEERYSSHIFKVNVWKFYKMFCIITFHSKTFLKNLNSDTTNRNYLTSIFCLSLIFRLNCVFRACLIFTLLYLLCLVVW